MSDVAAARYRRQCLLGSILLLGLAACGDTGATSPAAPTIPVAGPVLVAADQVVVVRRDRSLAVVSDDGAEAGVLGEVPSEAGEPDAVAVSPDGRLVVVSAVAQDDDRASVCAAAVLQVLEDGRLRRLAEGAAIALSVDGTRLAYFRHATVNGFCRRTALVVRDLRDGTETTVTTLEDGPVAGLPPPDWPVNWSPDGTQIAHVADAGAVTTQVATGASAAVTAETERRPLAPGWLPDGRLVVLHGCCLGGGSMRTTSPELEVFAVPAPVRSLRAGRNGVGAWFTVEEQGLHHWDGRQVRAVYSDALVTSG